MKRKRFTETQVVSAIKMQESGIPVKEICRQLGISDATFYNRKAKYGGMEANGDARMKELERENAELKRMYGKASIEIRAMKNFIEEKL
jgi:putative transposase